MALINTSWVGGGDVKLLAGMGVGFGWTILWILWIACLFGLVASLAMKKKSLPFAPFLFVGALTVALANHIPDFL
ncbi:MAG: hypothetical protein BAA01_03000 [Bacillus thermozeamaize]|uniref:Prepilin type IV endopeptidase peptidase domain-containing protein n=1 Tax=Bacillus thermozeamaize TaxID=230954 RepID=A0A1Y3PC13_9BACI|nr:MAG: hypothetical protein BAA01_03000 [Bacillus thermozeamaize]